MNFRPTETVRVSCPWCGRWTPRNVPRLEGPRYYEHVRRNGRERHRLVVAPDPVGDNHFVLRVADDEVAEDLIRRRLAVPGAFRTRALQIARARLEALENLDVA